MDRLQVHLNGYEGSVSNIWGTVIFKCCTSADWQLVEGNSQWDIQSGTKPVYWKRLINDDTSLWMPEVWNTSAPPVRGAATPTGPGPFRQLGGIPRQGYIGGIEQARLRRKSVVKVRIACGVQT